MPVSKIHFPPCVIAVSVVASLSHSPEIHAQTQALEEVVVTSRRTQENLQDVPLSVAAFSGEELEIRGMERGEDMMNVAPNVVIPGSISHASSSSIVIRGMPNVGIYLDGVAQSSNGLLQSRMVELERMEIMRGPQGTLFGRNSNGGAIQMISKRPAEEFGMRVKTEFGEYNRRDLTASVDVPLGDSLLSKFTAGVYNQDGQVCSLSVDACYGGNDDQGFRADFLWTPTGGDVNLRVSYDRQRIRSSDRKAIEFTNPFHVSIAAVNIAAQNPDFRNENFPITEYTSRSHQPGYPDGEVGPWEIKGGGPKDGIDVEFDAFTATLNWNISDSVSLESITGYWDKETFSHRNHRGGEFVETTDAAYVSWDRVWSQQFLLKGGAFDDRVSWLGGVWYEDYDERDAVYRWPAPWARSTALATAPPPERGCRPNPIPEVVAWVRNPANWNVGFVDYSTVDSLANPESSSYLGRWLPSAGMPSGGPACDADPLRDDNKDYALFGEVGFALNERLNLNVGVRWSDRRAKDYIYSRAGVPGTAHRPPAPGPIVGDVWAANVIRVTDEPEASIWFTPKVSLDYHWTDDVMLYASYAEGFTAAQVQITGAIGVNEIDPELVETLEFGLRSDWLDGRLRFNGSVFFTDWVNIRTSVNPIDPATGRIITATVTITGGNAEASGLDAELIWRPTENWNINAGLGLLNTEYKELIPGVPVAEGQRFPFAPDYSYSLGAEYRRPLANGAVLAFRGDYRYMDDYMMHARQSAQKLQEGFGLASARVTYEMPARNWSVYAYGTNLRDLRYWNSGLVGSGGGLFFGQIGPRREFGAGVRFDFD